MGIEDILQQMILPTYMLIVLEGNKHTNLKWTEAKVHLNSSFLFQNIFMGLPGEIMNFEVTSPNSECIN